MAISSNSNKVHHIRSISLPSTSNPTTLQIEEGLSKFKTWEASLPTAEKINNDLIELEQLYKCIDDLLSLPLTQQRLSHKQHEKWVNHLLDQSINLLDICGSTRDIVFQVKQQVRDLQSALRRRKGDLSMESSYITKYTSFRGKAKKVAKRLISDLKKIDTQIGGSSILDLDHHILSMIRVLREVSTANITVFQSLLSFLCEPIPNTKPSKWSMVSKLIHKGSTTSEHQSQVSSELEIIECHIEGIENGLESIFRSLVKTRASLINILSQ